MTVITYHLASGETREVVAEDGCSVMTAAIQSGVPGIIGECGGSASCATCHVYVDEGAGDLGPPEGIEADMLEFAAAPVEPGSRLGCQCFARAGIARITVRVPDRQV